MNDQTSPVRPAHEMSWFRNSSPYINSHRDKTFVIAFPGEAVSAPDFHVLMQDLVLLHSLGIRLVLVHGARPQIDQQLQHSALPVRIEQHRRVTDAASLPTVVSAIAHTTIQVQAALTQCLSAAHLSGPQATVCTGNFVIAKPFGIHGGVDFQHTGEVRRLRAQAVQQLLQQESLVLLSPLGYSPTGEVFNLLWEEVAEAAAVELQADKLIYLSAEAGLLDATGALLRELTMQQARSLFEAENAPQFGLRSAIGALEAGVDRVHVISFAAGALLQELFTVDGSGTLITQDSYEKLRLATVDDVASLIELIEPMEAQGILVRRSRELLENEIEHFTLIERDGVIIGCAALYPFTEERCGELACVSVHPRYRRGQRGDRLLRAVEQRALMLGMDTLFVLTTRTAHWFIERGFKPATIGELPKHRQMLYNYQRNSSVFIKTLRSTD